MNDEQAARVERHAALVQTIARRVSHSVGVMSVEELESIGNEALVRSAMRYDPSSPASFATFANYRVHGAMIDEIRKRTPGRRKKQRALRRLATTQALLAQAAEDQDAQRAAGQRQTLEERVESARELVRRAVISVRLSEPISLGDAAATAEDPDPEQLLLDADARARMWSLVSELEPDERLIIEGLYTKDTTMQELAERLGTSIATISRRHAKLLARLAKRARAQEWMPSS
ncbi:RNA polymerase sigma factor for flagellar operon [Enhygromyxa salina]|uniref:RNA polymerase sigma factor for flagellar operon n=1 Tax=Enhygromyxa salina TaxID=215803 RepID=A0A0C1ZMY2_9BACT|nr:RNA polymerase sigma factor for flagellar operon [Enhygromyxa salina]